MATIVKVVKNTHNRTQYRKYNAVMDLLRVMRRVAYPNGNFGFEDRDVRLVFGHCNQDIYGVGILNSLVREFRHGNPHTCDRVVVDPCKLTEEQETIIQQLLEKTQYGGVWLSRFGQHVRGFTPAPELKWLGM